MKKSFFLSLLGLFFLAPCHLFANSSNVTTCDLEAPTNLHMVSYGTNWIGVAWNQVSGATEYQVTTKNSTSGAVLSDFTIDQPHAIISNLPAGVHLRIEVKGKKTEGCPDGGLVSFITSDPLGLVFDLVLAPNSGGTVSTDCIVECSFTGPAASNPPSTQPQFECDITPTMAPGSPFVPFWLQIGKPSGTDGSPLFMYVHPEYYPGGCTEGCTIVEPHSNFGNNWIIQRDASNYKLLHIILDGRPAVEIGYIVFNNLPTNNNNGPAFEPPYMSIYLAPGYTLAKRESCINVIIIPASSGLSAAETTPEIHEFLTVDGTISQVDEQPAFRPVSGQASSTFRITNPVKNELALFFEKPTGQTDVLELYDMNGTLAAKQQLPEGSTTYRMEAGHLTPGAYVVRIRQESGIQTRMIVKQ